MPKTVRATEAFSAATKDGRQRRVAKGQVLAANDPVVKGRTNLFEDLDTVVERATANPGEKRTTKRTKPADA